MIRIIATIALSAGLAAAAVAATPDKKGCKDHPLLPTRMPDYFIQDCKARDFDAYEFLEPRGKKHREEGRFTFLTYRIEKGVSEQGGVAVVRNYENAITSLGGTIANKDPDRWVNGVARVDGKEVWIEAQKGNGLIWVRLIEKEAMKQHIVADAAAWANDLRAKGHVTIDGIFFDTGKAVVKPESKAALDEVAKLLKGDGSLRLWVVGHTDAVGRIDDNMRLAQARAEAVASELVSGYGIPASRLKGYGVGPLAPVADNDAETGRAKNRRVELVKQP
jgi:outer membrane protein OmpA-like peptidoglycan-associated protein